MFTTQRDPGLENYPRENARHGHRQLVSVSAPEQPHTQEKVKV